ncbi:MAG TPA: cyclic dehypoxanthinyl futalosine synthase [Bacteroidota bacterium]|nr:cyclic dehypoxanthinyl futalosine synthase [Bacteroidota bacterium]
MSAGRICAKALDGERLTAAEGLALLAGAPLLDLGQTASQVRFRHNPLERVTFHVDTNPNYTNICNVDCIFCAFYRHAGEEGAYTHTVDEMIDSFRRAAARGVTTILLQGGVNPALPLEYYLELVSRTVAEIPGVTPHFFSTSEIIGMARVAGLPVSDILRRLWDAGLRTIPGGGAEILSDPVKKKISHLKGTSADWLGVMREAHRIGYRTTATMMYGHLETDEDIVAHLESVRALQDETGGFTAFIPWSFKPGNTPLEKIIPRYATPVRYLQMIALARIYLDNVPHIQASWFSEGKKTGQIALHFGADDFGGTLQEENVHAAANFVNRTSTAECVRLIQESGFDAAQRTTLYDIIRTFERPAVAAEEEVAQ